MSALSRFLVALILTGKDIAAQLSRLPEETQRWALVEAVSYLAEKNRQRLAGEIGWDDRSPEIQMHLDNIEGLA
jgi:hypothetical protein